MAIQRKTIVSDAVLDILDLASQPISIKGLLKLLLERDLRPNKTTLYRIMDKLMSGNQIHSFAIKGISYYERLAQSHHHHHHFYCQICDQAFCLDSCLFTKYLPDLTTLLPNPNFKIKSHDFNLFGVCDRCQDITDNDLE
ncbi:hypothetical protein DID74_02345 [Candidatus Marinamargulisbacteria bacterium SCGC AG-333-B06]|nr:hypothetical protein DID74_02345 [Candidatus Marinamargulisbacteria bacterium SCGC AG-333-B06]